MVKYKNHENINTVLAQYRPKLLLYATRLLYGDAALAEDVVQDVFIKLLEQDPSKIESHLPEWLYTVCRNKVLDINRRNKVMTVFIKREKTRIQDSQTDCQLETKETHDGLLQLINQLPMNQQEVLRLRFQEGFSYKEISNITKLTTGNVGFLLHTALATLRIQMGKDKL